MDIETVVEPRAHIRNGGCAVKRNDYAIHRFVFRAWAMKFHARDGLKLNQGGRVKLCAVCMDREV